MSGGGPARPAGAPDAPRLIAVTGATGFLGAHIAVALATAGMRLRILTHRQPAHPLWRDLAAEIVTGSVLDPVACSRLVAGADAVVHAAGLIKATHAAAFSAVNAQGTAGLAQCVRAGAPGARFVLVSSLAAREPQLSAYAASKRAGELAAQAAFSGMAERLVILRPPALYGPWDRETLALFKAAGGMFAPVFGTGRAAIMHVHDAANAIARVAMGAGAAGSFALAGPDFAAFSVREMLQAAMQATGGSARIVTVPAPVLHLAGALSGGWARLRGRPDIFCAGKARELLHPDWTVSQAEALPLSVFQPRIGLPEGFRDTADWYRNQGWLKKPR